jgi:hypothetical protein
VGKQSISKPIAELLDSAYGTEIMTYHTALLITLFTITACAASETLTVLDSGSSSDVNETLDNPSPAGDGSEASDTSMSPELSFTHKMMKKTDENMFSSLAYECFECTLEQFAAIEPPEGWTKGPIQLSLSGGELRRNPSFEGVPDSMDFVPEIPGNEYELIAKTLEGKVIKAGPDGIVAEVQVMRDTSLRYLAGSRVHELTDPEDRTFVLIAHEVDPENVGNIDFQAPDALGEFPTPDGWTYSTRILDEELILDTPDIATVLAIRTEITSTWEMRTKDI